MKGHRAGGGGHVCILSRTSRSWVNCSGTGPAGCRRPSLKTNWHFSSHHIHNVYPITVIVGFTVFFFVSCAAQIAPGRIQGHMLTTQRMAIAKNRRGSCRVCHMARMALRSRRDGCQSIRCLVRRHPLWPVRKDACIWRVLEGRRWTRAGVGEGNLRPRIAWNG